MRFKYHHGGLLVPRGRDEVCVGGIFKGQIIRAGKVIDEWEEHNIVVNEGLDAMLAAYVTGAQSPAQLYMGLFSNNYQPTATDAAANFASNAGEVTAYTNSGRIAYNAVEANQSANNSASPATFTMNAAVTVYGAFLISSSQKNAKSGQLFAATQFSAPKSTAANDQLVLTYVVGISSSS